MTELGRMDPVVAEKFFEIMCRQKCAAQIEQRAVFEQRYLLDQVVVMLLPAVKHADIAEPAQDRGTIESAGDITHVFFRVDRNNTADHDLRAGRADPVDRLAVIGNESVFRNMPRRMPPTAAIPRERGKKMLRYVQLWFITGMYSPWTNGMGNVTMLPDTASEGAGFREAFKAYYAGAKAIPSLGFVFNNEAVANEMVALGTVAAQYALALDAGALDPETTLPDFLAALDAAGMQTYLDAANAQLESFMAAK